MRTTNGSHPPAAPRAPAPARAAAAWQLPGIAALGPTEAVVGYAGERHEAAAAVPARRGVVLRSGSA